MTNMFLTAKEIADILKISKALAYRLISQGQITSIRFGRVSRVRQEDLDTFVQKSMLKVDVAKTKSLINIGLQEKGDVQHGA